MRKPDAHYWWETALAAFRSLSDAKRGARSVSLRSLRELQRIRNSWTVPHSRVSDLIRYVGFCRQCRTWFLVILGTRRRSLWTLQWNENNDEDRVYCFVLRSHHHHIIVPLPSDCVLCVRHGAMHRDTATDDALSLRIRTSHTMTSREMQTNWSRQRDVRGRDEWLLRRNRKSLLGFT